MLRPTAVKRQGVDTKARLQRRITIKLAQHDLEISIALQLNNDTYAVTVGFVTQIRNTFDALIAHRLRDLLHQARFVDLIGDFGNDDSALVILLRHAPAHDHRAAPGVVGRVNTRPAHNQPTGREIGTRHDLHQGLDGHLRVVDQCQGRRHDLAQIVGRHVGGHADGDAAGAVDQQIGKTCRQHRWLVLRLVVIGLKVNRVLIEIIQQRRGRARQTRLGITHGGRPVAVHGTEIALTIDQRQAHGKILRHPHHGIVDSSVPVRVVLAHYVADHTGRLTIGAVPLIAVFLHGKEDAAVHRLEAITHIWKRTTDDHTHGIIKVGALHLLLDRHWRYAARSDFAGICQSCLRLNPGGIGMTRTMSMKVTRYCGASVEKPTKCDRKRTAGRIPS